MSILTISTTIYQASFLSLFLSLFSLSSNTTKKNTFLNLKKKGEEEKKDV